MSERISKSNSSYNSNSSARNKYNDVSTGVVEKIILDDTNLQSASDVTDVESKFTFQVGYAVVSPISEVIFPTELKNSIPPYSPDEGVPLVGETVELVRLGGRYHYKRIPTNNLNTSGAEDDIKKKTYGGSFKNESASTQNYSTISQTGISNSATQSDNSSKIGEYFTPTQINKLKLYEGDKLIETRFGQSIRFSAYNNSDKEFSPTIILRNRQNSESISKLKEGSLTEEDITKDGSTIVLSSNKYKLNFQPGLVDDGGSSNFKTTPIKAKLPKELVGYDQMLLNSERIILSSKSQEMLFFSKGNYGFISDGKFTIDNGQGGADLDFGDDVNITTDRNNGNFTILTGTGNIFLNTTKKKERIVRGDTLVKLLTELIDAINQQVYNTPAGPSAVGPNNRSTFNDIKSKLKDALSTLNYTE